MIESSVDAPSPRVVAADLAADAPLILPSLLLCDFGRLAEEVQRLEDVGVRAFHLDVMDGHFVPNLTYGPPIVEACRRATDRPIDCHLMISQPERYIEQFRRAGADSMTIHVEAVADPRPVLKRIRELGSLAGLALNPGTPLERITDYFDCCDLILVMSVEPGFGGQAFEAVALEKLRRLRQIAPPHLLLEVDGGVNLSTIQSCAQAGAQMFVVGSAIFGSGDYGASIRKLTQLAQF